MTFLLFFVFFFQAEDGIRDLVRSRGLGDVYKRQDPYQAHFALRCVQGRRAYQAARRADQGGAVQAGPVSYTHLTLPTSDLV